MLALSSICPGSLRCPPEVDAVGAHHVPAAIDDYRQIWFVSRKHEVEHFSDRLEVLERGFGLGRSVPRCSEQQVLLRLRRWEHMSRRPSAEPALVGHAGELDELVRAGLDEIPLGPDAGLAMLGNGRAAASAAIGMREDLATS